MHYTIASCFTNHAYDKVDTVAGGRNIKVEFHVVKQP